MGLSDYSLFLISQAFSELGDHLWSLGLRNYLFENSPWTPAAGLAAVFVIQAIPVFLFGPWLSQMIRQRWRTIALIADSGRLFVTLGFAFLLFISQDNLSSRHIVYLLLATQFFLELGSLVFQNCRNCLVPVLYPHGEDISRAHLWANVSSLSAAALVPLIFIVSLPSGGRIQINWLVTAALIDGMTFLISGAALLALRRSTKLKLLGHTSPDTSDTVHSPLRQFQEGLATARKYPAVVKILFFSFLYNLFLMGPVEIGLVTFLRRDLGLPPVSLAINMLLLLCGIFAGTFAANAFWKSKDVFHLKRFSHSIFWDGVTFFPICLFAWTRGMLPERLFQTGLCFLFFAHYMVVPFVKVSRLSAIQTLTNSKDWSSLLGFHAIAVEGAAAISVIAVALSAPNASGTELLAWGGIGATACGLIGLYALSASSQESLKISETSELKSVIESNKGS